MESFFGGMTLSLAGVSTLVFIAYQKGWLRQAASRVANESEHRSRDRLFKLVKEAEQLRQQVTTYNKRHLALASVYGDDLQILSRREGSEIAQKVFEALTVDLPGSTQETRQLCQQILQAEGEPQPISASSQKSTTAKTTAKTTAAKATVSSIRIFQDSAQYACRDPENPNARMIPVPGRILNDRLEDGEVLGVDFFAVPLEWIGG